MNKAQEALQTLLGKQGIPTDVNQVLNEVRANCRVWSSQHHISVLPYILFCMTKTQRNVIDLTETIDSIEEPLKRKLAIRKIIKNNKARLFGIAMPGVIKDAHDEQLDCFVIAAGNEACSVWEVWQKNGEELIEHPNKESLIPDDKQTRWFTQLM